jgi:hypothetical protein
MLRVVLAVVAGVVSWAVIAVGIDTAMSVFWPDYVTAKHAYTLDLHLDMMLARLAESTVALVVAAVIAARVAPTSRAAPWAMGIVMLLCFIPVHYHLWDKFPIWYHAYFLSSLVVLPPLVARLARPAG